jgi:hypothetical protein
MMGSEEKTAAFMKRAQIVCEFYEVEIIKKIVSSSTKYVWIAGLPDFSWCMIPKPEKMYQMNTKCTKW